jgi:hypothetical protein
MSASGHGFCPSLAERRWSLNPGFPTPDSCRRSAVGLSGAATRACWRCAIHPQCPFTDGARRRTTRLLGVRAPFLGGRANWERKEASGIGIAAPSFWRAAAADFLPIPLCYHHSLGRFPIPWGATTYCRGMGWRHFRKRTPPLLHRPIGF